MKHHEDQLNLKSRLGIIFAKASDKQAGDW